VLASCGCLDLDGVMLTRSTGDVPIFDKAS